MTTRLNFPVLIATLLIGTTFSFAAIGATTAPATPPEIADCWSESGMDLVDGEFSVGLELSKISKANLLKIMSALSGVNIEPMGYPLIFDKSMFIYVRAVDNQRPAMMRDEFKQKAVAELFAALSLSNGTSASCNFLSYPSPAVGVVQ